MCYRISDMGLCKVEKGHTYTLDEFRDAQFAQLNEVTLLYLRWYIVLLKVMCLFNISLKSAATMDNIKYLWITI